MSKTSAQQRIKTTMLWQEEFLFKLKKKEEEKKNKIKKGKEAKGDNKQKKKGFFRGFFKK